MKIVSYNCRSLGSKEKKEDVGNLIIVENPSKLILQEMKLREHDALQDLKKNWNKGLGKAIGAKGAYGGLYTVWYTDQFQLVDRIQEKNRLFVKLSMLSLGMLIYVINVYMPNNYSEKLECWDSLLSFQNGDFSHSCILAKDFNITRTLKEKRGGSIV